MDKRYNQSIFQEFSQNEWVILLTCVSAVT